MGAIHNAINLVANLEKIKSEYNDDVDILNDYFFYYDRNKLAETAFIGQIKSYKQFGISPSDVAYSDGEHKFRIECLNEELDELRDAHAENNVHEVIDAIVDFLIFTIGTTYRAGTIVKSASSYSHHIQAQAAKIIEIGLEQHLSIEMSFYNIAKEYVQMLENTSIDSKYYREILDKLIALSFVILDHFENQDDMITYYKRVLAANNSKILGPNTKRGSYSLDLIKPEGWTAPSFDGLAL